MRFDPLRSGRRNSRFARNADSSWTRMSVDLLEPRTLLSAGALDPSFGSGGTVTTPYAAPAPYYSGATTVKVLVQPQPDGTHKIVAVNSVYVDGHGYEFSLARYNTDGSLDTTFGSSADTTNTSNVPGIVVSTFFTNPTDSTPQDPQGAALQSDGKIVVVGGNGGQNHQSGFWLLRYNPDGSLDTQSFGPIVGGVHTGVVFTRLPVDSTRYTSVDVQNDTVAVDSQDRIVVGGTVRYVPYDFSRAYYKTMLVRYTNADGSLDGSFAGGAGIEVLSIGDDSFMHAIAVQPDDRIVTAGLALPRKITDGYTGDLIVSRFNSDGGFDGSFGGNLYTPGAYPGVESVGSAPYPYITNLTAVAVQSDADGRTLKILAGGGFFSATQPYNGANAASEDFGVFRLDPSGTLDTSFGLGGLATADFGGFDYLQALAVQSNGDIVTGGYTRHDDPNADRGYINDFAVAKVTSNGLLDANFGSAGRVTTHFSGNSTRATINDIALTPEGILAGGSSSTSYYEIGRIALARYLNDVFLPTSLSLLQATGVSGGHAQLSATLTATGSPVAGKTVTFTFNGTTLGTAVTGPDGVATFDLSLAGIVMGTYGIGASFAGDSAYAASAAPSAALTVLDENLLGMVWVDFNNDGNVDFGEQGIDGVTITLTGTDDLQAPVNVSTQTADGGIYSFSHIRPGRYTITEGALPSGYVEGKDALGTLQGDATVQNVFSNIPVGPDQNGLNYNFGERPAPGSPETPGQVAGSGFWTNKKGQALIASFGGTDANGNPNLSQWLAQTLPHVFGPLAGDSDLTGKTPSQVAQIYQEKFALHDKLDAQVLATALNVYATNASLGGGQAAAYGFAVSQYGLGNSTYNIGADGAAFGVANGTALTIMQVLDATDAQSGADGLYHGSASLRKMAKVVYGAINAGG